MAADQSGTNLWQIVSPWRYGKAAEWSVACVRTECASYPRALSRLTIRRSTGWWGNPVASRTVSRVSRVTWHASRRSLQLGCSRDPGVSCAGDACDPALLGCAEGSPLLGDAESWTGGACGAKCRLVSCSATTVRSSIAPCACSQSGGCHTKPSNDFKESDRT